MIQILEEETVCDTDVVDTFSAVGLLILEVIIRPLVSVFGYYWNLQFLDNVIKNWMHSFEVSLGYESVDRSSFSMKRGSALPRFMLKM